MKKGLFVGALVTLLWIPSYAYAKGSATISFEGNNSVNVGDEFKVNMIIDNVNEAEEGVVGFSGFISFDNNLLEIVDAKSANEYFDVTRNKSINKIVGVDYSLAHGINNKTNVYEITFRGINEGNTTITLRDGDLSDKNANLLDVNANGLNVTVNKIEAPVEVVEEVKNDEIIEAKPVYTSVKEEKVQTQERVIEEPTEIKEETIEAKEVKTTKKVVKKTKKNEKNLLKKVSKFFKKIFKKVA